MPTLYLMRHATAQKAEEQDEDHLFSVGDEPLSEAGQAEAQAMAELLADAPIDGVHASPAKRCQGTAHAVAEPHGLEVETHEALWEVPYGEEGMTYEEVLAAIVSIARRLRDHEDPTLPDGSSWQAVTETYRGALESILSEHEAPLVVGHGAQNRAYLTQLLGMPSHRLFSLEQDHGCLNLIGYGDGRVAVLKMNVTVPPLFSEASSLAASD